MNDPLMELALICQLPQPKCRIAVMKWIDDNVMTYSMSFAVDRREMIHMKDAGDFLKWKREACFMKMGKQLSTQFQFEEQQYPMPEDNPHPSAHVFRSHIHFIKEKS